MVPIGDDSPGRTRPVVTYGLIVVNVLLFVVTSGRLQDSGGDGLARQWGFTPAEFRPVTLLTSMFLHAGVIHLAANMIYLWVFGDNVEDALGHLGYLGFYLGTGVLASVGHYVLNSNSTVPAIGASGAISGILGAYLLLFPRNRVKVVWFYGFFLRVFTMRAGWLLAFYFLLQIIFGIATHITYSGMGMEAGVAYWAHIGGFAAGLGATALLLASGIVRKARPMQAAPGRVASVTNGADAAADKTPAAFVEGTRQAGDGADSVGAASREAVSRCTFPADASARLEVISRALAAGDIFKAIAGAHIELRLSATRGGPAALAPVGDVFCRAAKYGLAFELYSTFLARAGKSDVRLPEVNYRAGVVAVRHLRMYDAALGLLTQAARTHDDPERVLSARRLVEEIEGLVFRTTADTQGMLLSGPCAVVRRSTGRIDVSRIGRLVSELTGQPLAESTRMLHSSPGFVAVDVGAVQAKRLAAALAEAGVPALVVPGDKLVALPPAHEVSQITAARDGLEFTPRGKDTLPVARNWNRIFFVSAGLVTVESAAPPAGDFDLAPGTDPLSVHRLESISRQWAADELRRAERRTQEKTVLDVFTLEPFECYRCSEGETRFIAPALPGERGAEQHLGRFAQAVAGFGAGVPANEGVVFLALESARHRWRGLTFSSVAEFSRYNYWRLQLEQYG